MTDECPCGAHLLQDVLLQRWLHDLRRANPKLAMLAESQTPEILTRKLIDGTLDVAIMIEPAQLDILQIREITALNLKLVSSEPDLSVEQALDHNYVSVDWGLSFSLDYRRTFPDAREAITRVSHPRMALDYISLIGGNAYLPHRMIARDVELGLLHAVAGAPIFTRIAYAIFPVRTPRLALIESSLKLIHAE
jgi:DNA-binding transcriptional LysR family regulator